ncbi:MULTISPECIES: hypothetical protein [unclassified Streptomyces]|uniref:Uncharacterized protein n=1 Tax=Streptomyces sp. R17 TaxID=3238626 RepID=A0AB39NZF9_9ACTN|nr:hypothetical protein [Streptomyces sp. MMS20-AI2-20]
MGYEPSGEVADAAEVSELLRVAGLCCITRLVPPTGPREHGRVLGDTTEGALLVVAAKAGQACVKGAPGELLARCTDVEWDGRRGPLTGTARAAAVATSDERASQGLRVLAVARWALDGPRPAQEEAESALTLPHQ